MHQALLGALFLANQEDNIVDGLLDDMDLETILDSILPKSKSD
jgi:hypothetical protein